MRKLIHKKWLSIPVTVFLVSILTAGAVFAAIPTTQTITQTVYKPDIGVITADNIILPDLKVGKTYQGCPSTVTVKVGPDGADKYLHMSLDETSVALYDRYRVCIETADEAYFLEVYVGMGGPGWPLGTPDPSWPDILEASVGPLAEGTYTFTQCVLAIAGSGEGTAEVKVTYALKNDPVAP